LTSDPSLQQGSIVWASVSDARGQIKKRPVLIITATDEIVLDQPIVALAITGSFPDPPLPTQVELPWSRTCNVVTGLKKRSAVVCDWVVAIRPSQVHQIAGYLPTARLLEVLTRYSQLADDKQKSTCR